MEKFICIHGHFYQPPRENPWLEAVQLQDSAHPYHDWNERITAECYAPNSCARFLDTEGHIQRITSNYAQISFNFGPTVLSWMKANSPQIHQAIVDADHASQTHFGGHGSAIAQCYNHLIMPLANVRDKRTQVIWGIRDFESRFQRPPEGMWLPETAADNESLDALAEQGIKFTILSPYQAKQVRQIGKDDWQDVNGGRVDPSMPYLVKLPSGRSIAVFFYDGPIAQAVAFERLLSNGERFGHRLMNAFSDSRDHAQLVNIATDGESYGHHFQYGDMALAYALQLIESNKEVRLTVYGEFLERQPPTHEVEIHEPSAWSCPHGVGRWKENCGCNSGGHQGWNQEWRGPLREAMDWLRDQLAPKYETKARDFFKDPWLARDDYISVILDRSAENISDFFRSHGTRELNAEEQITALRLLEMQRHAMLMYTSCGWFFDEISGLETVQVIQYAARAIQLAEGLFEPGIEAGYLDILAKARSNLPENRDGRDVYQKYAKPAMMTREMAGAHYAVSSLFESYPETARIYSFSVHQEDRQLFTAGKTRLAIGRINVTFEITRNSDLLTYAVVDMGDHNLNCGVRLDGNVEAYQKLVEEARGAFERADFAEIIRLMDKHFGETHYSLKNLFRDEQRKVLNQILASAREDIHNTYRLITDRYAPLAHFLADLHTAPLKGLQVASEIVLNSELRHQFDSDTLDVERVRSLLRESAAAKTQLDTGMLGYAFQQHLERLSNQLSKNPADLESLKRFANSAELVHVLSFPINLWESQNNYNALLRSVLPGMQGSADAGDGGSKEWVEKFLLLGERLGFRVERSPG